MLLRSIATTLLLASLVVASLDVLSGGSGAEGAPAPRGERMRMRRLFRRPHPPFWGSQSSHSHHKRGPPPPPFLRNVTEEARREFGEIFRNENLTRAEVKVKVQEWAAKQEGDVPEQVKDFKERMDRTREQASQNATAVVAALKGHLETIKAIMNDDSLSFRESWKKVREADATIDRDVAFAAHAILHNAHRRMWQQNRPPRPAGSEDLPPPPPPPFEGPFPGPCGGPCGPGMGGPPGPPPPFDLSGPPPTRMTTKGEEWYNKEWAPGDF